PNNFKTDLHHPINSNLIDIGVTLPWSMGYDGSGVVIAVLDDGSLDYKNQDIMDNYDEAASYDFVDYDKDPMPEKEHLSTSHGTKCAGIIAAAKNRFCGIGVAFNSSIGGIRMLNLKTTDSIEASALSYQSNYIDIYSCNWGPKDDGLRFGKPGPLTLKALRMGATKVHYVGRRSLGSIYVWSSGNGGSKGDDCNADGYVTNIYTIAIGAISGDGSQTSYSESCASMLGVTLSGSSINDSSKYEFVTTDMDNQCIDKFSGTSSSASVATGIIALMLQSNPLLTWRDVQYLIVETSIITNPTNPGWTRNGAGKWFNPLYGFGKLDAFTLVDRAYHWETVKNQKKCRAQTRNGPWYLSFSQGSSLLLTENITKCYENGEFIEEIGIKKLEHVQIVISITHICRGRITIELLSPSGTRSVVLKPRIRDTSSHGIHEWVFTSVHFWGEDPRGIWTTVISDMDIPDPCSINKQSQDDNDEPEKNVNIKKNSKYTNKSDREAKQKEEVSRTIAADEAENIENSHEHLKNPKKGSQKYIEDPELSQNHVQSQNNSMIERIVVEKYRLLQPEMNTEHEKSTNQFVKGDIKVIINDQHKRLKEVDPIIYKVDDNNSIDDHLYEQNDELSDDEELWKQGIAFSDA
ncbi:hypothetical protein MXB_662, partial [Myxobolus squamalis]